MHHEDENSWFRSFQFGMGNIFDKKFVGAKKLSDPIRP